MNENTYQDIIDTLKVEQAAGLFLAKGERKLKDTAAPSTARLLEIKALEKYKLICQLDAEERNLIIQTAANDFEAKTGRDLRNIDVNDIPRNALARLDDIVLSEYVSALIDTGTLSQDEIALFNNNSMTTRRAIIQSAGYAQYRENYWKDVRECKAVWIIFDEFKAFMKQYWENRI